MCFSKKMLVCITAQSNSKRLIDRGSELAGELHADLHILHVEKGDSLSLSKESTALLQHLFDYGTELGGMVHGLCGEDVVKTIINFIKMKKITNVLLGEPPENAPVVPLDVPARLRTVLPYVSVTVLSRGGLSNTASSPHEAC